MSDTSDNTALVTALLASAGVHPSAKELASLGRLYPSLRAQVDLLYAVDTGDAPPVGRFAPAEGW